MTGPRTGRRRGYALLVLAIGIVVGAVALQPLVEPSALTRDDRVVAAATSGTAYCPVTASEGDRALLTLASAGTEDSEVVLTRFIDGVPIAEEPRSLAAGQSATIELGDAQGVHPVTVDWRGGPVVAQYRLEDAVEVAVATCATAPSDLWHLAGFDTSLGSRATLHLFNPFTDDALAQLSFGTPEGRVDLVIADELLVPAGDGITLNLADFRPETPDLAVTVATRAGRVIAQGEIDLGPPAEGVEATTGRALIPAAPATSDEVWFADAATDAVTRSWLTVYNPAERAAAVAVQVSTPLGAAGTLTRETTVPAGGTTRIALEEVSALPRFGVRLTSVNGVPVTASRTNAIGDRDRTGVSVQLGVPDGATAWTVAGGAAAVDELTIYNPEAEGATVSVAIAGGVPQTWTAIALPPNGMETLSLADLQPQGPARITADGPIVAGIVSLRPETATAYWGTLGVAQPTLTGPGVGPPVARDPSMRFMPALSATATPLPEAVAPPQAGGEGIFDGGPGSEPTPPALTPTPQAPTPAPTATGPAPAPPPPPPVAPTPTSDAVAPTAGPTPSATDVTESEGSLFGKQRRDLAK